MHKGYVKKISLFFLIAMMVFLPFTSGEKALFFPSSGESTHVASAKSAQLDDKIEQILNDESLNGAVTGVSILNAANGESLFENLGDTRLHPASNMKLLTGVAAMETLGADYQFTTEVLTDGRIKGKVLHGNLYLKGKGDPTLMERDLDQFAKELKAKGIKNIKGNLIADDSWYGDVRLSQDINWSDEPFYTAAQISALTLAPNEDYDAGTVIVEVTPSTKVGESAQVKLTPETDYVTIVNKAKTVAEGAEKDISIEREHGSNNIVIEGTIPTDGSRSRSWSSVWEPTGYALDVFKKSLEENGIKFIGKSEAKLGVTPKEATVLTSKKSMPLKDLFIPFMKLSNNGHAEVLVKEMGKIVHNEGSWDKGLQVVEETISALGINTETIMFRDGSGMSHKNMVPANEISQMLFAIQDKSWFPAFEKSLPVAGNSERFVGGTLRNRMTEEPAKGNVLAKTGSLTGMSALSGYVTTKDGEELIFSIMVNNYLGSSSAITAIEDKIATTLAKHEFE
ncbi:D-alanyl-D-alanine carboxypeptidase/D-alanyl-D-alanine endopeptidase [Virgibacillus necropolis]|uniref:D-alanyl-D-alanine carboxypeptidase/D-alanyl-D-alanine-endopeptidase n=1 Tax=Virgibacillus necropolis TaxID=163877 RepID=A0A221M910_9BACI|nr:D-alanyl-D-alanine carboxypeptidase/D-alanyl-D-alanine-endopeptidase [Virgibacillus necropolis]ASN04133.1 D-alanyl-D-alanine carboxypeptidase/D-alanyl-D-alanine-endopeptidase [Virgibacillus necropolis]